MPPIAVNAAYAKSAASPNAGWHSQRHSLITLCSMWGAAMSVLEGRYAVDPKTGCHVWHGSRNTNGYGKLTIAGQQQYAHRVAFELAFRPLVSGETIDHLCRNRACCNPAHLDAVSLKENVNRSPRARKSHCSSGHALTGDNLYIDPKGFWKCRTCKAAYRRSVRQLFSQVPA